jgi:hypothetical protein
VCKTTRVARIEAVAGAEGDPKVCITFQVDRERISFQVPIFLSIGALTIPKWFKQH